MTEQRWVRVLPVAFVMYAIAYIDRTNIALALSSVSRELHMTPTQAGNASGVFFWGYLLLQIPGGYLAEHWSAKRVVGILLAVCGLSSLGTAFVHTGEGFLRMRFLLGISEGGIWPATLVLLARWFPSHERARANAYWMLCFPIAAAVSSPLSGWILGRWNWRVLLVSEGLFPIAWLPAWWLLIYDRPVSANWITTKEQVLLERLLSSEESERHSKVQIPAVAEIFQPLVLTLVTIQFLVTFGNYAYLFWLPSAIEHAMRISRTQEGFLFATPYIITIASMVVVSKHSDAKHERRWHVAASMACGGIFLIAGVFTSSVSSLLSFLLIALSGAASHAVLGPFWAIPTETLPSGVVGPMTGLVSAVGNLGGYFGPLLVGCLDQKTGNFVLAFVILGLGWIVGAVIAVLFLPPTACHPGSSPAVSLPGDCGIC